MVRTSRRWQAPSLDEADDRFLRALADDTEEAPWMVMADLQFWPTAKLAESLQYYARAHSLPWYVASMLPIRYRDRAAGRRHQLAPDVMVALGPDRHRSSYDLDEEMVFPAFILEVVSPSSARRDQEDKREAYRILGAHEYALFTPRLNEPSGLGGYRRGHEGEWQTWPTDERGRLWSGVLGLYLVVQGEFLRAQTSDGAFLPTYEELQAERERDAEARRALEAQTERDAEARRALEAQRQHDAEARRALEAEVERLRRALGLQNDSELR